MSRRKGLTLSVWLMVIAGGLSTGCRLARVPVLRNYFVPPATKPPEPRWVVPDPPPLDAPPALRPLPMPLDEAGFELAESGRVELLIREAEAHFQAGRRRYQEGDAEAARRHFDQAIDLLLAAPDRLPERARLEKKLEELVEAIHRMDLAGLGAGDTSAEPGFQRPPLEDIPALTFLVAPELKDRVSEQVRAMGSQLPVEVNDAVLGYIQYFTSERGRKIMAAGLRRMGCYRPLIQRILDEEGLPQELIHYAQAESGFQPRAVSRKRAMGLWQFVRGRAREYGLAQTPFVDERLDPEKSTRAAARHLLDLYHHFGDWYLAMAAYNCGPGIVERAVERTGYADFWELRRRNVLPKETANHVPVILAMTILTKNAQEYGLDGLPSDPPIEYDAVEITAPTHLPLIADLAECTVSEIRELNPALLKNLAPAGYSLRVPKETGAVVSAVLQSIPAERRASWRVHRLGEGESLAAVAQRYRATSQSILVANRALGGRPEAGDLLLIPAAAPPVKASPKRAVRSAAPAKPALVRRAAN